MSNSAPPAGAPAGLLALLDRLEELRAAATAGEWAAGIGYSCTRKGDGFCPGECNEHRYIGVGVPALQSTTTGRGTTVADCGDADDDRLAAGSRADAEYIAALHNALPALLTAARRGAETPQAIQEMRAALEGIGVRWMPDEEAGEGWASWTTNTEDGEAPAESLGDALATMQAAAECDGRRSIVAALREHWLTGIECDHARQTDVAICYCSTWRSEPMPSVGEAVSAWIAHVTEKASK